MVLKEGNKSMKFVMDPKTYENILEISRALNSSKAEAIRYALDLTAQQLRGGFLNVKKSDPTSDEKKKK